MISINYSVSFYTLELFRTRALEMQMSATNTLDMQIASQTIRDLPMTINNR